MFNINIPIDDYIDKTFKIQEDMIILPRKKDGRRTLNISMSLDEKDIDNNIINALSDGFINGYIESCKDLTKTLLMLNYSYDEIINITNLSIESIYKIEDEL